MATTKTKYRRTSKGAQIPLKGLAGRVAIAEALSKRAEGPKFRPGDTIRVQVRIKEGEKERVQAYEGVVIAEANRGASRSITVRKISHGVGVERIFLLNSPKIARIELVQEGKVRRAKLYYLRGLEGKAAKIERDVETLASAAASKAAAAKAAAKKPE